MTFRPPRVHRRRTSKSPSKTKSTSTIPDDDPIPLSHRHLVEPHDLPRRRRGYGTKGRVSYGPEVLLAEPNRRVFTQPFSTVSHSHRPCSQPTCDDGATSEDLLTMDVDAFQGSDPPTSPMRLHVLEPEGPPQSSQAQARKKKERQWTKWATDVIPSLIQPYLDYLCSTNSLRESPSDTSGLKRVCTCGKQISLTVTAVYFERE